MCSAFLDTALWERRVVFILELSCGIESARVTTAIVLGSEGGGVSHATFW